MFPASASTAGLYNLTFPDFAAQPFGADAVLGVGVGGERTPQDELKGAEREAQRHLARVQEIARILLAGMYVRCARTCFVR